MRLKIGLLSLAGTLLAIAAAGLSFVYLSAARKEVLTARADLQLWGAAIQVPMLKSAKAAATALTAEDFDFHKLPETYLSAGMVRELPEVTEGSELLTTRDLLPGELLSGSDLAVRETGKEGETATALRRLDGHQLAAVRFRNYAEMAPYLASERSIDIFWTSLSDGQTRLLSSAAMIVALPPAAARGDAAATLLLSMPPEESARAFQAARDGEFDLTLSAGPRSADQGGVLISAVELRNLPLAYRDGPSPNAGSLPATLPLGTFFASETEPGASAAPARSSRPTCPTTIVRGGQRVIVEVPC